jgi:hypothetical protein
MTTSIIEDLVLRINNEEAFKKYFPLLLKHIFNVPQNLHCIKMQITVTNHMYYEHLQYSHSSGTCLRFIYCDACN